MLPPTAARERGAIHRRVIETGRPSSQHEFLHDSRLRSTVLPLDADGFGHAGVLVVLKHAPFEPHLDSAAARLPLIASPALGRLVHLSSRELQVLYYIASGMTTNAIAESACRSSKTIEKQINSIHTKLRTGSRAELVRFAAERGIQSFSDDEWQDIVEGARVTRREMETRTI